MSGSKEYTKMIQNSLARAREQVIARNLAVVNNSINILRGAHPIGHGRSLNDVMDELESSAVKLAKIRQIFPTRKRPREISNALKAAVRAITKRINDNIASLNGETHHSRDREIALNRVETSAVALIQASQDFTAKETPTQVLPALRMAEQMITLRIHGYMTGEDRLIESNLAARIQNSTLALYQIRERLFSPAPGKQS